MTLRDLGYRPYDGPRLPASSTTWVMYRYGLRRAVQSVLVKVLLALAPFPALVMTIVAYFAAKMSQSGSFEVDGWIGGLLGFETWIFAGLIGLLVGATTISEDLQAHAFPFLFSKPLTPRQYLLGRVLALVTLTFSVVFVPAAIFVVGYAGAAPPELRAEAVGFVLPVFAQSALVAITTSLVAVGVSASSSNRAVPMSLWVVVWIVPAVLAGVVRIATDQPYLDAISIPRLLSTVSSALLRETDEVTATLPVGWALLALAFHSALATLFAIIRLERAEVVS